MTAVANQALIFRIRDPRNKAEDLVESILKLPETESEVLDALDARIISENRYFSWLQLTPYLQKHYRPDLVESLCKNHLPDYNDLAMIFRAGYGGADFEERICKRLYETFSKPNTHRLAFVEALLERGSTKSLAVLRVIKHELEPDITIRDIAAPKIADSPDSGFDGLIYIAESRAQLEFFERVQAAINAIHVRQGESEIAQNPAIGSAPANLKAATKASRTIPVSPLVRANRYLQKATNLLPAHPAECLNNVRKAIEAICTDLLDDDSRRDTGGKSKRKPSTAFRGLEDKLSELRQRKILPQKIVIQLETMQKFGNFASHDQEDDLDEVTVEMANANLTFLIEVISWYKAIKDGDLDSMRVDV
jgi:hypothetical protein